MGIRTALVNITMAFLIPLTAVAKKPESEVCQLEVASTLSPGMGFEIVIRPAKNTGPWNAPTVDVEVSLPITSPGLAGSPESYNQIVTQTFDGRPGIARAFFIIPEAGYLNLDMSRHVEVFATVSEPVNRGKSNESFCDTTAGF